MLLRQIVLDTETTGLSPKDGHRIIEIGCLEIIDRRTTGNNFHYYINPEREVEAGAIAVHGLTSAFLQDKPLFKEIAEELLQFIAGAEVIIHNASFDVGFLNSELQRLQQGYPRVEQHCVIIDSLAMARRKHPGQPNNLDALCNRYAVDRSKRGLHGALLDAQLLAQIYLAMTCGQKQFVFEEGTAGKNSEMQTAAGGNQAILSNRAPLPIIEPSESELLQHQAFRKQFKKVAAGQFSEEFWAE